MMIMIGVAAPLALMAGALLLALRATLRLRRRQAANDHDTPLITALYRAQTRWAAALLALALGLLATAFWGGG